MKTVAFSIAAAVALACSTSAFAAQATYYQLPPDAYPHDVAPAPDGTVWYSGQQRGFLGRFDPKTGKNEEIPLGPGAAPHGVIVGPDGAAWVTEGGQNAIARVDPATKQVKLFPLPKEFANANLNTADLRQEGQALVHRAERRARPGRSRDRQGRRLALAASRQLRHHLDARRRRLVRLARRRLHRQGRHRHRRGDRGRSAAQGLRAAPHLVGLPRQAVGELLERRRHRPLRPRHQGVDGLSDAQEQVGHLRGLCRRQGPRVGDRLARQFDPALRSRRPRSSRPSRATSAAPACARCWAVPAKRGAANPATTGWW